MSARKNRVRLGFDGYARILAELVGLPSSWHTLVAKGLAGKTAARRFCTFLHSLGSLHISGWEAPDSRPWRAIYSAGPGQDVPVPERRPNGKRYYGDTPVQGRFVPRPDGIPPELLAFNAALIALQEPITAIQMSEETGVCIATTRKLLQEMQDLRLIYVADYMPRTCPGGPPIEMFHWGPGKSNKKRPRPLGSLEVQRVYRVNKRLKKAGSFGLMAVQLANLSVADSANDSRARIRA